MADPLSITASVVGITTATIQSLRFICTIIGDIKDVSTALENLRSDFEAIKLVLKYLLI